ncbi:MAG: hypothetical protein AAGA85_06830 [Bacteroidota bacterium]
MEEEIFEAIRQVLISEHTQVHKGQIMRSPAILYNEKVFAFFSRKRRMVFKLGENYPLEGDVRPFNPFKNKGPMKGWYEVDFSHLDRWQRFAEKALNRMSQDG